MMLGTYNTKQYCILIKNFRFIIFIKYLYKIKKGLWYNGKKQNNSPGLFSSMSPDSITEISILAQKNKKF